MKLYNPTNRVVYLRDEINRRLVVLKPKETLDVQPHLRASFTKYANSFGLQWLLDDDDLSPSMRNRSEDFQGTVSNFKKTEKGFDAQQAMERSDSTEIADIWREHDTVSYLKHEAIVPKDTDFLFLKDDASSLTKEEELPYVAEAAETTEANPFVTDEGPDYLRNTSAPEELDGFGAGEALLLQDDAPYVSEGEEDHDLLPDTAPVTISQLRLSTKAQLWEMGDRLGIDTAGTKVEIITRICQYHWKAHQLRLQMMQNR